MKRIVIIPLLLLFVLFLGACSSSPATNDTVGLTTEEGGGLVQVKVGAEDGELAQLAQPALYKPLTDEQGFVGVTVTPKNLNASVASLEFEVSLETHSVDLSMDLASLATLTTDNGQEVTASLWDAPRGGHHVSGVLLFPSEIEGVALLDGASRLTLTIRDVDAPERIFVWDLQ